MEMIICFAPYELCIIIFWLLLMQQQLRIATCCATQAAYDSQMP